MFAQNSVTSLEAHAYKAVNTNSTMAVHTALSASTNDRNERFRGNDAAAYIFATKMRLGASSRSDAPSWRSLVAWFVTCAKRKVMCCWSTGREAPRKGVASELASHDWMEFDVTVCRG
jgi:hypothetical protein